MAPVAVDSTQSSPFSVASLKQSLPSSGKSGAQQPVIQKPFADSSIAASYGSLALVSAKHSGDIDPNRPNAEQEDDPSYPYNHLKPSFPIKDWEALQPFEIRDRGLDAPSLKTQKDKKDNLVLKKATSWKFITPALGVEIHGVDLRKLTDEEKNDFALLGAQVGVIIVRDQGEELSGGLTLDDQLEFGRYFGPLHKHATTAVPKNGKYDEVHLVYADSDSRPDTSAFAKEELIHSDVTYEIQPPGLTSLRLVQVPEVGGDTIFSSGSAIYSSFSPAFQTYLESLYAVHSAVAQANGARAAGNHVRRQPVESIHPVVRVHPVTGVKSIFVNPGFTRRILNIPKPESDAILKLLFKSYTVNVDFQVRASWAPGTVVFWENRIVNHTALFDFAPQARHGVRVTPQGEKPLSVAEYEEKYGVKAKDWAIERAKELGIYTGAAKKDVGGTKERGFKD